MMHSDISSNVAGYVALAQVKQDLNAKPDRSDDVVTEVKQEPKTASGKPSVPENKTSEALLPAEDRPKAQKVTKASKKSSDEPKLLDVRKIPEELLAVALAEFPCASRTDALSAYLSVMSGVTKGLNDRQLKLVKEYTKLDEKRLVLDQLKSMDKKLNAYTHYLDVIEILSIYLLFDRLGFRLPLPSGVTRDNFDRLSLRDPRFEQFIRFCRSQATQIKNSSDSAIRRSSLRKDR